MRVLICHFLLLVIVIVSFKRFCNFMPTRKKFLRKVVVCLHFLIHGSIFLFMQEMRQFLFPLFYSLGIFLIFFGTDHLLPSMMSFSSSGEASSSAPNLVQHQQGAGPSNQPLPVEAYPYSDNEVIGGDSVRAIQRRLLAQYPFPSAGIIDMARIEAQDLFEVKVKIIHKMAQWDPTGDWLRCGARALENPRTASGEESLERLYDMWTDLQETGPLSDVFSKLEKRVFKKG
jgi:hypothetical protein